MKVIHIESGLGNQMLSYSELLLLRKLNPIDDFFIETIIYDIPECNEKIKQWYGYELKNIFNIDENNIRTLFCDEEWNKIINEVRDSHFWVDWNYPPIIVGVLKEHGISLENYRGEIHRGGHKNRFFRRISNNRVGYDLKRITRPLYEERYIRKMSVKENMFIKTNKDIYTGQWLGLMKKNSGIEFIETEIRNVFQFPKLEGDKNLEIEQHILNCNSVAIHARRGDALGTNGYCYRYGYFKRAVSYIKANVENPVFYFFTDPGSMTWIQKNMDIFSLNIEKDHVFFVDWNGGVNSYRDMQLMAKCKHNIITCSTFGWWGAWLNDYKHKITCSPSVLINTTHHF